MTLGPGFDTEPRAAEPQRPAFDFMLGAPTAAVDAPETLRRDRSRRRGVDTRSLTIPIVVAVLIVGVVGGAAFTGYTLVQNSEAAVAADSAAWCANLATTPGVLTQPAFGWPTDYPDIASALESMHSYEQRWADLSAVAPPTISADVDAVAQSATLVTDRVEASKTLDRNGTLASMQAVTSKTRIVAWAEKYCAP